MSERPTAAQVARALTKAQARVIKGMDPIRWYQSSDLKTSGGLLMELSDFQRDLRGISSPIQLVFWDRMEPEGIRIWQLSVFGEQVSDWLKRYDEMIDIGGRAVRKFIPYHGPVDDGTPRCISCGQIDEPDYHDDDLCARARGGA